VECFSNHCSPQLAPKCVESKKEKVEGSNHPQHVVEFARANLEVVILYLQIRSNVGVRPCVWRVVGKKVIAFVWHRLIRRLGLLLFVLPKSNQKALSSKGSLSSI
jgi:hypothetical protein